MDFRSVIDVVRDEIEDSMGDPFLVYRDAKGEWQFEFTQTSTGETADWVAGAKEKDPFAMNLSAGDFISSDYFDIYNTVMLNRLRMEYYAERTSGKEERSLGAFINFLEENVDGFSRKTKDYLITLDKPFAALVTMCPFNMATEREGWSFNESLAPDAVDYIENAVFDRLLAAEKAAPPKRVIEGYEEKLCIRFGGRETVLAENQEESQPYLVCSVKWDNPFGAEERYDGIVTEDYTEAMREFVGRVDKLGLEIETARKAAGLPLHPLDSGYCLPDSKNADWNDKVVIIKTEYLAPEYRSAEHQYIFCTGGNGARPDALGQAVFAQELFTGRKMRYERHQIAGLADPARMPEWTKIKLELLQDKEVFEFGGYHFKPERKFGKGEVDKQLATDSRPSKNDIQYAMRNMSRDNELRIGNFAGKNDWSHDAFYAAAKGSDADIFRCLENGKLYVPGENELFRYSEPPQRARGAKKPSMLEKLDDNKEKVARDKETKQGKAAPKKHRDAEVKE